MKKIYFYLPFLLVVMTTGCSLQYANTPVLPSQYTCTQANINYASDCNSASGCSVQFSCKGLPAHLNGANVSIALSSVYINHPYLLKDTPGYADPSWYNGSALSCQIVNNNVSCSNFLPIAADSSLNLSLTDSYGSYSLAVPVQVNANHNNCPIPVGPATPNFNNAACGLAGSVVQRMFDCSTNGQYVSGIGTGAIDNGYTAFDVTYSGYNSGPSCNSSLDPKDKWFLVSCPDSIQEHCFWLSPTLTQSSSAVSYPNPNSSNPQIYTDFYDSFHEKLSTYVGRRILWSGSDNSQDMSFFKAAGKKSFPAQYPPSVGVGVSTPNFYDYYFFTVSQLNMPAPLIVYIAPPLPNPPFLFDSICPSTLGAYPTCLSNPNTNIYANYNVVTNTQDLCTTNQLSGVTLPSFGGVQWQVPSYPMLLTLSGGGLGQNGSQPEQRFCENGIAITSPSVPSSNYQQPECLQQGVGNFQGFRAISNFPGFSRTNYLLSSSIGAYKYTWLFYPDFGRIAGADNKAMLQTVNTSSGGPLALRCAAWF